MANRFLVALASAPVALLVGCHSDDLPTEPPTRVTKVATGGFVAPSDAVASPDGKNFFFAAFSDTADEDGQRAAGIYKVSSKPGSTAEVLASGDPLASPMGLVMSCDGKTLFVADMGNDAGAVYSLATGGGAPADLAASGIFRPAGLAMGPDCDTLFITGHTPEGKPALFSMPTAGGATTVVYSGDPLVSPTGLHVDDDGVAWVMDHLGEGAQGEGVLWAIPSDGSKCDEVASGLKMGTPGGVSLTAGGGTAVMPTTGADGKGQLTTVSIKTGERVDVAAPDMIDPAGLRTARKAGVFAVVDSEGGAIYRAE